MKKDIESVADIELMVNSFYNEVKSNSILGHIFENVAKVDWQTHLPKMYSFWSSLLLGEHSYSGNPMVKHIALSKITPLTETEFSTWLLIFNRIVDLHFQGSKAEEAKSRAANIAQLMLHKIEMH